MAANLKIGIDCGGVLSASNNYDNEANEEKDASNLFNIDSALDSIIELKQTMGHDLFLISFCGRHRAEETRHLISSIVPDVFNEMYFVKKKTNKAAVVNYIGCDVMIDDTLDVLEHISKNTKCTNLLWFTGDPNFDDDRVKRPPSNVTVVNSWTEIIERCKKIVPIELYADPTIDLNNFVNKRTYKY